MPALREGTLPERRNMQEMPRRANWRCTTMQHIVTHGFAAMSTPQKASLMCRVHELAGKLLHTTRTHAMAKPRGIFGELAATSGCKRLSRSSAQSVHGASPSVYRPWRGYAPATSRRPHRGRSRRLLGPPMLERGGARANGGRCARVPLQGRARAPQPSPAYRTLLPPLPPVCLRTSSTASDVHKLAPWVRM